MCMCGFENILVVSVAVWETGHWDMQAVGHKYARVYHISIGPGI